MRKIDFAAGDFLSEVVDATLNFLAGMMRWNYLILPEPGEKPNPGLYNWRPTDAKAAVDDPGTPRTEAM